MNPQQSRSILIPTSRSITLICPQEIVYVKAMQNYCMLYMVDGTQVLVSLSFGSVLKLLTPYDIFRCHRSYAVQINKVIRYLRSGNVELEGNVLVPVARRRKIEFLERVESGY